MMGENGYQERIAKLGAELAQARAERDALALDLTACRAGKQVSDENSAHWRTEAEALAAELEEKQDHLWAAKNHAQNGNLMSTLCRIGLALATGLDPQAILAARDERVRREGAAVEKAVWIEILEEMRRDWQQGTTWDNPFLAAAALRELREGGR